MDFLIGGLYPLKLDITFWGVGGASTAATTKCGARRASQQQTPPPLPLQRCPRTPQGRGLCPARREVPAMGVATQP